MYLKDEFIDEANGLFLNFSFYPEYVLPNGNKHYDLVVRTQSGKKFYLNLSI